MSASRTARRSPATGPTATRYNLATPRSAIARTMPAGARCLGPAFPAPTRRRPSRRTAPRRGVGRSDDPVRRPATATGSAPPDRCEDTAAAHKSRPPEAAAMHTEMPLRDRRGRRPGRSRGVAHHRQSRRRHHGQISLNSPGYEGSCVLTNAGVANAPTMKVAAVSSPYRNAASNPTNDAAAMARNASTGGGSS